MMKTLLAGAAALAALPAIAQTTMDNSGATAGDVNTSVQVPVETTTNDHSEQDDNVLGTGAAGPYTQVNGGVSSSATATPGMAASDNTRLNTDASAPTSVANGSMDGPGAMTNGMVDRQSGLADGTMRTQGTTAPDMTNTTGMANGYTGVGGPAEPRDYPMCSRTVTDSCMQRGGR